MKILLNNLRFYAYHGVLPQERTVGAYYTMDVTVETDFSRAMLTDDISCILNYADVYKVVKAQMQIPSRLLEHVVGRIMEAIFTRFEQAASVRVRLVKEMPPIRSFDGDGCGVEAEFTRETFFSLLKNNEMCK